MIIAQPKPIEEVARSLKQYRKIVIAACGTCMTVSLSGGEKEAEALAQKLREMTDAEYTVVCPKRQCDKKYLEPLNDIISGADAVLSLGCGAGVQFMAERYEGKPVVPGLNTSFNGVSRDSGYWTEMCQGCGKCVLGITGGICPVSRCAKSHFNGPCGGCHDGKCEVDPDTDCAWYLIYQRLKALGKLERLYEILPVRDWSSSRHGGPRRVLRPGRETEKK